MLNGIQMNRRSSVPDWVILAIACVAQFMVVLDVSIVNVALPSIGRDLHYSSTGLQSVVNAYVLTFAGFLLLGGRAADIFGRRRVYIFGLTVFTVASLVGGLAQDPTWLTTARAVQGVGGAFLSPATLTIIVTTYSGPSTAKALGVWSAVAGGGGAAGSVLGGVLTAELSWRWILFVNIPIGIGAVVAAMMFLGEMRRDGQSGAAHLDLPGAVLVTGGLAALTYAIVGTDSHPWGSAYTLGFLGAAIVLLAVFAYFELRVAAAPLVPFGLFRSRSLTGANLVMLLIGGAFFSFWFFLSLYLQNVLGYSALRAGMAFLPMALAIMVAAQVSSRLLPKLGVRPLLMAGTVMAGAGFLWLSLIGPRSGYWADVFGPAMMISAALGVLFTPLASAATSGVAPAQAGLASGVLNTARQMGGSLGLAVLATIATDRSHSRLGGGRVPVTTALTSGYRLAFVLAAGLALAALLASRLVPAASATGGRSAAPAGAPADGSSEPSAAPAPA